MKDATNLCHARTLPGLLAPALGITIEEYEAIPQGSAYQIRGTPAFPGEFSGVHYADWVQPRGAAMLAGYADWHMQDYAAVTRHTYGRGIGWYVGTVMTDDACYDQLIQQLLRDAGITPAIQPPPGVEVSIRRGPRHELLFLINHTEEPQTVPVPPHCMNALTKRPAPRTLTLDRHGVVVLRRACPK